MKRFISSRCVAQACVLIVHLVVASGGLWAAESHEFDSDGVKIHYTDEGQGPPVILVHGYRANGELNWRIPGTIRLLKDHYRVITLDNRGHGKSDKPEDVESYGLKMVDDVVRLMDHLKLKDAHVVGYSMGGLITFKLAAQHPQRVRSAVIGGMGWLEPQSGDVKKLQERLAEIKSKPMASCLRGFNALGLTRDEVKAVKVPLIVIVGTDDGLRESRVTPLEEVRPDIPVLLIPKATHVSCIFNPTFREGIKKFLDEQSASDEEAASSSDVPSSDVAP